MVNLGTWSWSLFRRKPLPFAEKKTHPIHPPPGEEKPREPALPQHFSMKYLYIHTRTFQGVPTRP